MNSTAFDIVHWVLRILLAAIFIGMGINHLRPSAGRVMAKMIPPRLRGTGALSPHVLVIFTGLCEIAGGIGILLPATRLVAGICLAVFLVAVFPANVYAARNPDTFKNLAVPLLPRTIAQVVLIGLVAVAVWP